MSKEKIYIFDTTLRDGAQTEGVDFSIEDKNKIAKVLSDIGIDYVEGGWPGANPVDTKFFAKPPSMKNTLFTAFGMTKKTGRSAANDPGLAALINANTPAVCVVGKSWDFHVKVALVIKNEENLEINELAIKNSINSLDDKQINLDQETITTKIEKQEFLVKENEKNIDIKNLENKKSKSNFI